jgi:hypothetical protein
MLLYCAKCIVLIRVHQRVYVLVDHWAIREQASRADERD